MHELEAPALIEVVEPRRLRGRSECAKSHEQMVGNDQAQQLGIGKLRFPAANVGSGQTDPGQDPIIEEDVKCGQEGVEVIVHTKGLAPSATD